MSPALAANAVAFSDSPEGAMVPFQRATMERIRRKLRNVKVQQLAKRAHMAIGA